MTLLLLLDGPFPAAQKLDNLIVHVKTKGLRATTTHPIYEWISRQHTRSINANSTPNMSLSLIAAGNAIQPPPAHIQPTQQQMPKDSKVTFQPGKSKNSTSSTKVRV